MILLGVCSKATPCDAGFQRARPGVFPKEIAYTKGMDKWNDIAGMSYQTIDEQLQVVNEELASTGDVFPKKITSNGGVLQED